MLLNCGTGEVCETGPGQEIFCELVHLAYGVTVENTFNPISYFFYMYIAFLFYLFFNLISSLKFLGSSLNP